ncbi:UV excision repair protein rad23 [Oleoguttula sp. CCFEE 5521]
MKLTFKDLKQQKFTLDAEATDTIASLKSKISSEKGWEPSSQKLIYSGKILQDDNTVESYKIEEKGFIVCMIAKPKPAPKAAAAPPATPAKAAEPATPAVPAAPAAAAAGTSDAAPATPSPAAPVAGGQGNFDDPSALAVGEERSAAIANMESMGFPRADIDRAMRAAFYNPDRAVEYLLNGIPASAQQEQRAAAAAPAAGGQGGEAPGAAATTGMAGGEIGGATAAAGSDDPVNLFEAAARAGTGGARSTPASGAAATTPSAGAGGDANQLDFLRNNPQFQQLRQVVQQQPQMLEPILQQVAAGNPQLAQIITQNPEQFMQLLAEDADEDVALPPGAQQISVTEEEREAIERLCRLGFERDLVIQAYFACDKNEELAANFLFDQPDEPEE